MSDTLNVIALISGGKDSLFSLLHCLQNGHKIVALANLFPPTQEIPFNSKGGGGESVPNPREGTDLNSFMYQTVGHSLIPLYATALQLPLYRRQITGTSAQQSQHYDTSTHHNLQQEQEQHTISITLEDETEDLIPLLQQILSNHPEANAISTGAILSTYQRSRIESVAVRLGLTPLSYLWQYPVLPPPPLLPPAPLLSSSVSSSPTTSRNDTLTSLLDDMASANCDARIIKIASAGIPPETCLFANVADPRTRSRLLNGLAPFFGEDDELGLKGAVLGEGGEYETLALSGPRELWKGGRVEVEVEVGEGGEGMESYTEAGVTYVKFGPARVVPHSSLPVAIDEGDDPKGQVDLVRVPALLDPQFENVKVALSSRLAVTDSMIEPEERHTDQVYRTFGNGQEGHRLSVTRASDMITINNLTSSTVQDYISTVKTIAILSKLLPGEDSTASSQLEFILDCIPTIFSHISSTLSLLSIASKDITSTTLLLASMNDFATVNPIYSRLWPAGLPNPPARVTIATRLPPGVQVSLSLNISTCPPERRRGLHVQGRSYWAPANIGPYSQAISVPLFSQRQLTSATSTAVSNSKDSDEDDDDDNGDNTSRARFEAVHIAGQIPLLPATMSPCTSSFTDSAVLSLQHLWRIGQERGVDAWPWGVAYLAQTNSNQSLIHDRIKLAAAAWEEAHEQCTWTAHVQPGEECNDDPDSDENYENDENHNIVDVWDLRRNPAFQQSKVLVAGKHLHILPNRSIFIGRDEEVQVHVPPFLAVEVISLPRLVDIEWWSQGIATFSTRSSFSFSLKANMSWHQKGLPWGTIAWLSITPNIRRPCQKVVFVTVMVILEEPSATNDDDSIDGNTVGSIPTTLRQVFAHLEDGWNDLSNLKLIQGTTYLSADSHFSNEDGDPVEDTPTNHVIAHELSKPITESTTIIPCHTLHGSALLTMPYRRPKHRQQHLNTNIPEQNHVLTSLSAAHLLRVETT